VCLLAYDCDITFLSEESKALVAELEMPTVRASDHLYCVLF
jgi:hypothetical protein